MSAWDFIPWILWIVGLVGVGGTIALFIFAPAVAGVLLRAVASFITTPIGAAIVAGAACLFVGIGWGDYQGRTKAEAACAAKITAMQQAADEAAQQRDQNVGVSADTDAQAKILELVAEHQKDQEAIDALRAANTALNAMTKGGGTSTNTVACHPITEDELNGKLSAPLAPTRPATGSKRK